MNDLVLFKRYIRTLNTLELNIYIAFLLFITIGEVCMLKFETSLLGVNNVIEWKISFSFRQFTLFPLPIQGMFYRWSCDLIGELPQTSKGNVYNMIMIEHFSKWVKLIALLDKSSHITNQAFLQQVLSRFGACAECLTNQGSKFRRECQYLLDHALIDHRRTSRDHPQADGLVERMVQTYKKGLWKICLTRNKEDWGLALPYIAMGYKMSNTPLCLILLTFYFLGDISFHPLPLLLKWTRLWTCIP